MKSVLKSTLSYRKKWFACFLVLVSLAATQLAAEAAHQRPTVRLKGVNVPGLEYNMTGDNTYNGVRAALDSWGANCVRIPLNQSFWFGYDYSTSQDTSKRDVYRARVDEIVNYCTSKNAYVILDLHWTDQGEWGLNQRQHWMPDNNSTTFWADCASRYANRWNVIFNLYNEPRVVGWDIWKWGGTVNENGKVYQSPGHQSLLNTVRARANNWVLADANYVSTDISGLKNGYALNDPLDKTGYSVHLYPVAGQNRNDWDNKVTWNNTEGWWIQIGEWGADDQGSDGTGVPSQGALQWSRDMAQWLRDKNLDYTAWGFNPNTRPTLLNDFNYTPTSYFGSVVKSDLGENNSNPTPTPAPNPTPNPSTNVLSNPGFEAEQYVTQTPSGWGEWSNKGGVNSSMTESGSNKSGNYHLTHWNSVDYNMYTYQTKTGLANGTYTATAWVRSSGGQYSATMEAKDFDGSGTKKYAALPTTNTYTQITISGINVTNGQCTIGFWSDARANQWINADDVTLTKQ